ncbi:MAG: ABC transporter substrate binding protein [Gammaproteobacteria bacterium]
MNKTEQGVRQLNEIKISLIQVILLVACYLASTVSAEELPADTGSAANETEKQHVFVLSTAENALQSDIIQALSENLKRKLPNVVIIRATPEDKKLAPDNSTDIIIGIGPAGMKSANTHYPKARKLFISTNPNRYRLDKNKYKDDAILYMSQPYCRQIKFIKLIHEDWKVIGLLNSQKKPVDIRAIKRCAKSYEMELYTVKTTAGNNLSDDVKLVLDHSDLLLALPDKNIYNSRTVKNILLTSYRYRKPVIAFSRNFVNAGALASIHSSAEQIGESASRLIEYSFKHDLQFKKPVNYPLSFDVDINRQVFKALGLPTPNLYRLKQELINNSPEKQGHIR